MFQIRVTVQVDLHKGRMFEGNIGYLSQADGLRCKLPLSVFAERTIGFHHIQFELKSWPLD